MEEVTDDAHGTCDLLNEFIQSYFADPFLFYVDVKNEFI